MIPDESCKEMIMHPRVVGYLQFTGELYLGDKKYLSNSTVDSKFVASAFDGKEEE